MTLAWSSSDPRPSARTPTCYLNAGCRLHSSVRAILEDSFYKQILKHNSSSCANLIEWTFITLSLLLYYFLHRLCNSVVLTVTLTFCLFSIIKQPVISVLCYILTLHSSNSSGYSINCLHLPWYEWEWLEIGWYMPVCLSGVHPIQIGIPSNNAYIEKSHLTYIVEICNMENKKY